MIEIREWEPVNNRSSNQYILNSMCKQYPNNIRLLIVEKLTVAFAFGRIVPITEKEIPQI